MSDMSNSNSNTSSGTKANRTAETVLMLLAGGHALLLLAALLGRAFLLM